MNWQLLIAISILAGSTGRVYHRHLLKDQKVHSTGFAIAHNYAAVLWIAGYLLFAGFDTSFDLVPPFNFVLLALLWGATDILINSAIQKNEAMIYNVLFATRIFWTIFVAMIFLDERLTATDWAGTLTLFASVLIVAYKKGSHWKTEGVVIGLSAAVAGGLAIANDGIILQDGYDVSSLYFFAFLLPAFVMQATGKESNVQAWKIAKSRLNKGVIILGGLYAISGITFFEAFQNDQQLSIITALGQSQNALIAIGAILFLNERDHIPRRIFATALSIVGVLLIVIN